MVLWRRLVERVVLLLGLTAVIIAFWPPVWSLYGLTGEERLPGQLAGVVHWLNTAVRPQPLLAPQEIAHAKAQRAQGGEVNLLAVSPFGINTFLQLEAEPEKRVQSLELIRAAGFDFIRQEFVWEDIEIHGKGDFVDRRNDPNGVDAWAKYDQIVEAAEANDIEIIARLSNPPSWTRALTDTVGSLAPPDDFNDFGDFAAAVAERYQGQIQYYQLWNEPNGNEEWGLQNVDPEAYTRLLCIGYERIKGVDPQAVVLAGALTPTVANDGRHMNDLIFLQRMYNAGAADCFDVFSAQGYGLWSGATDHRLRPTVINYPHHAFLRDIMVRHGDGEKPIWISEMGWNVVPEGIPPNFGRVTEEQQARYGVEAYQRSQVEWPWIGVINYWFFKRHDDSERDQSWYYFRMMEPDFTPLPVYDALAAYATTEQNVEPWPDWVYKWSRLRPMLFLSGIGVLFLWLLKWLSVE